MMWGFHSPFLTGGGQQLPSLEEGGYPHGKILAYLRSQVSSEVYQPFDFLHPPFHAKQLK